MLYLTCVWSKSNWNVELMRSFKIISKTSWKEILSIEIENYRLGNSKECIIKVDILQIKIRMNTKMDNGWSKEKFVSTCFNILFVVVACSACDSAQYWNILLYYTKCLVFYSSLQIRARQFSIFLLQFSLRDKRI